MVADPKYIKECIQYFPSLPLLTKDNAWSVASPPSAWKIRDTLINARALPSSSIHDFGHPKQKPVQRRSPQIPDAPINGGEIR